MYIGYKSAASIAKESLKTGESVKSIVLRDKILDEKDFNEIMNPMELTKPGIAAKHLLDENK